MINTKHRCDGVKKQESIRRYTDTIDGGGYIEKQGEYWTLAWMPYKAVKVPRIRIVHCPYCGEKLEEG